VKLIRLNNSDEIASVTRILKEEEDDLVGEGAAEITGTAPLNGQATESEGQAFGSDEAPDSEVTE